MTSRTGVLVPAVTALALAGILGCGGSGPSAPSLGGGGLLSATINGTAWSSQPQLIQANSAQKEGHYPIYGASPAGSSLNGMQLNLVGIQGPGTYPLGTAGGVSGGTVAVNEGSAVWMTPINGAAGTVTITTLTSTRAVGTFQFVADPVAAGATGPRTVANGQFDIPLTRPANLPPMTQSDTGYMSATMGGAAWNGASGGGGAPVNGALFVIFTGTTRTVAVTLAPYGGPGTYQLGGANTAHRVTVTQGTAPGAPCCWGGRTQVQNGQLVSLDVGTVTITSATASRIRGTFSATLQPGLTGTATTSLAVAGGSFSFGFP
jgi:hypothetical protein